MRSTGIPFDRVRRWTFDEALPFWAARGFDFESRVFRERVALDGAPDNPGFLRVRVLARQIYVFSHASVLDWGGPALERAQAGYDFLMRHCWVGESACWARRVAPTGQILDPTADLYDHAFVLFALSWFYKAKPDEAVKAQIARTYDAIRTSLAVPDGLGFLEADDHAHATRLQNPHMHMLEGLVAAHQATGEQVYLDGAKAIFTLFCERCIDRESGTLCEVFAPDWGRLDTAEGRSTEPGHQMEWAWLLLRYSEISGEDTAPFRDALIDFAERKGVDPTTGLTYDGVDIRGAVTTRSFRCWPQTETLKAHLARFEATGALDRARVATICRNLFEHYLATKPAGLWMDQLDGAARPVSTFVPASTLYHIFVAFSELLRLERAIKSANAA